jgi:hypothetical protein
VGELVGAADDVQVGADGVRVVGQAVTGSVLAVQVVAGPADQHIGLPGGSARWSPACRSAPRPGPSPAGRSRRPHGQRAVDGGVAADVGQPQTHPLPGAAFRGGGEPVVDGVRLVPQPLAHIDRVGAAGQRDQPVRGRR